jgi:hypothetical protein
MEYPKINTLWKREVKDGKPTGKILEGDYSRDEFKNIKLWHTTEKIHGTNIRVVYHRMGSHSFQNPIEDVKFFGKTNDAMIPPHLLKFLQETFTIERFRRIWPYPKSPEEIKERVKEGKESGTDIYVILFGEGYGPKVQSGGGRYRDDASFILFDAWIDGWWLQPNNTKDIAQKLGIDYVPELGLMTVEEIVALVKQGFKSKISKDTTLDAEGIVARSHPLLLFRDGKPLMFKLKQRDYK